MGCAGAKLRVAFCHYTADICGGSDRSLFDIVTHLPRDRFDCRAILKTGDPMAEEYRKAGIDVVETRLVSPRRAFEIGKHVNYAASYLPSALRVRRAILDWRADIVHVNTLYNLVGPAAARLSGRPLVWHVREILKDSKAAAAMLRLVSLMASRAIAISPAVAETLHGCGDRLRLIPNGIDLSEYEGHADPGPIRREFGLESGQPVVTTIGRLEPWKGQHVFVRALPEICRDFPNARAFIVGGSAVNKPEYARQLRDQCRELGLETRVTFTGIRKDIPAILAASDVLVLPTITPEPFGRSVIEAMAAGRPVVATAMGGPLETVADGETGFLIPPEDSDELARKVTRILSRPELSSTMGNKGRRRAIERYSLTRLVDDMSEVFEEIRAKPQEKH